MERSNQTNYDLLKERNEAQERTLSKFDLPAPALMSHSHVTVRSGMVQLTFWSKDAITPRQDSRCAGRRTVRPLHALRARSGRRA